MAQHQNYAPSTSIYDGNIDYTKIINPPAEIYFVFTNNNGVVNTAKYTDKTSADAAIVTAINAGTFLFSQNQEQYQMVN